MSIQYCFIKKAYYEEHPDYINMLDPQDANKQSKRTHIGILLTINNNTVYIPLRNNLGESVRKYGKIGFSVPSAKRPHAGLDYRYALIINDDKYIELHSSKKIPKSQELTILNNYGIIQKEITTYVARYIKVAKKGRVKKEPLFRESSLINFHEELGIK